MPAAATILKPFDFMWAHFLSNRATIKIPWLLLIMSWCLGTGPAHGQATAVPAVAVDASSRVVAIRPKINYLRGEIFLKISNLSNFLASASQKQKPVVLFINGMALTDVSNNVVDIDSGILGFQLQRTPANRDTWSPLLVDPIGNGQDTRLFPVSAGLPGESPLPVGEAAKYTYLWVIGWNWWTIAWFILLLALALVFFILATYSDILRGPVPDAAGRKPFSLSRTQAAFWLFITAFSFVFIWAVTNDTATLNTSVLALIGISAGTAMAANFIEGSPSSAPVPAAPAPAVPAPAPAGAALPPVVKTSLVAKIQKIRFVGYFLGDILTDDTGGISIHRFQIFVWTLILGIIFLVSVINELSMPEFNGTLLALMGISSATYIGNKLNQ
jgi:hypothetical protein